MKEKVIRYKTGWTFTADEELALLKLYKSQEWKAFKEPPEQAPIVDRSHYERGVVTKQQIAELAEHNRNAPRYAKCDCPECGKQFTKEAKLQIYCRACLPAKTSHGAKAVLQMNLSGEVLAEYPSLSSASFAIDRPKTLISYCCSGKLKTAYGYKWKFKD